MKPFCKHLSTKGSLNPFTCFLLAAFYLSTSISSFAQECTLPSRIFIPSADQVEDQGMGSSIDVDGEYMVAGAQNSSVLQAYAGIAFVYRLGSDNQWAKIAELRPSVSSKHENFGSEVSIRGNTIVVRSREYDDDGNARSQLYVYDKPLGGEWVSSTENYVIEKDVSLYAQQNAFGPFHLHDDELISTAVNNNVAQLEIYGKVAGVFTLKQTIDLPVSRNGRTGWGLQVTDDFVTVNSSDFEHSDRSNGAVYIYEKNATAYNTTPIAFRSSEQSPTVHTAFGFTTAATNETIYVAGWINEPSGYRQTFYVFEKPAGGWADKSIPYTFKLQEYNYYDFEIAATNEYLFTSSSSQRAVTGVRKNALGWSSPPEVFQIDDLPADNYAFGEQISLSGDHLVVGAPARFLSSGRSSDRIIDYYSPSRSWNDPSLVYNQILREVSVHATDDFFGNAIATNDNQIAIGANGDDDEGANAGAVYIFNILGTGSSPTQKIYCPEKENFTGFGASLAMRDSLLFIGAPYIDSIGSDKKVFMYNIGKVYVYRLTATGWRYSSQIVAPTLQAEISFGRNVTAHGDYVAVTEFYTGSSESVGTVHLYKQDKKRKFNYLAKLTPTIRLRYDYFGQSVVMNDSLMVIGTGLGTPNTSYRTSAFVFKKKGEWKTTTEDARLQASDGGWADRFATSVSMYGDYILVGAPASPGYDPRPRPRDYIIPGAAYLYKKPAGGWKGLLYEEVKITPSNPSDFGNFGYSVAIDHDDIFIGAPDQFNLYNYTDKFTNNDGSLQPGAVYHYKKPKEGWKTTNQEFRQIQSFEPDVLDGYGATLFISNRYLYVGATLDDTSVGYRTGSVQTMMQLPVIDSLALACTDQLPITLQGFPRGGTWTGPGVESQLRTFSPSVAGVGRHQINYEVSGCQTSTTAAIIAEDLDVLLQSEQLQTKCIGKNISLIYKTGEEPKKYSWFFRGTADQNFSKVDSSTQQVSAVKPGLYRVEVQRDVCPEATSLFTVVDEAPVDIDLEPVDVICSPDPVQLAATPGAGTWAGAHVDAHGKIDPRDVPNGSFKALYKVITPLGCVWKDSLMYQIDLLREPRLASHQNAVCKNNAVTLSLENIDAQSMFVWYDASGNPVAGGDKSALKVTEPGTYHAVVSKHSCSFTMPPVTITAIQDSLFVPNVFTTNGDHLNDAFEIEGTGLNNFHLMVFNKYGKAVFETRDQNFQWSAAQASSGVYYWRATYSNCSNEIREQKGWVHILKNE